MTAEVCVMNKLGVALAADSAVTARTSGSPKIFQSAEKLFLLSECDPVGVMVYGSAEFLGVPWETIIKRYRKLNYKQPHESVRLHAEHFAKFLSTDPVLFPEERQSFWVESQAYDCYIALCNTFWDSLKKQFENQGTLDENRIKELLKEFAQEKLAESRLEKVREGFPEDFAAIIESTYAEVLEEQRDLVFGKFGLDQAVKRVLLQIACEFFANSHPLPGWTGVVVAGFGQNNVYPALCEFAVDSLAAGELGIRWQRNTECTDKNRSIVVPFAQQDMVQAFMNGIDPGLEIYAFNLLDKLLGELPVAIADLLPMNPESDTAKQVIEDGLGVQMKKLLTEIKTGWSDYQKIQGKRSRHEHARWPPQRRVGFVGRISRQSDRTKETQQ